MQSNEIVGYQVINILAEGCFVTCEDGHNYETAEEPLPISIGDAYRRLAGFLEQHPDRHHGHYVVEPVYREFTPVEKATKELGSLLSSLCARHGVQLGLSQEQIESQIARELSQLGAH